MLQVITVIFNLFVILLVLGLVLCAVDTLLKEKLPFARKTFYLSIGGIIAFGFSYGVAQGVKLCFALLFS